jgi:hypothetical protein
MLHASNEGDLGQPLLSIEWPGWSGGAVAVAVSSGSYPQLPPQNLPFWIVPNRGLSKPTIPMSAIGKSAVKRK